MYYNKKYWKFIINLYKYKSSNTKYVKSLAFSSKCRIPAIFKNITEIYKHTGKDLQVIKIKYTGVKNR